MMMMLMVMMIMMIIIMNIIYDDDCFDDDFDDAHDKNDDDVHDDNTDDQLTCEQHLFCKLSCEQCDYDGFELTCEHKYFCEVLVIAVAYLIVEIQIPHEANAFQIANFQIFRLWQLWHHTANLLSN